jgi:hypothetical protein
MGARNLTDLPAKLQGELRAALGVPADQPVVIAWNAPHTQARVIVEVWDRDNASSGCCTKRYLIGRVFWWTDAVAFAAQFEMANIHHTVVPADEARERLLEMELADPSEEYLRLGRIWDLAIENCRRFERQPALVLAGMPTLVES